MTPVDQSGPKSATERPRRSLSRESAPKATNPLTVFDGAGETEGAPEAITIEQATVTRLGDFAAAMVGPITAAAFAKSLAVFVGSALLVLLVRAQGRRSALTGPEIGAISPLAAALGAGLMTFAVAPNSGAVHALSAGLIAMATGACAALLIRLIARRFVHTRIAVLGSASTAHEIAHQLELAGQRSYTVIGSISHEPGDESLRDAEHVAFHVRRLGLLDDLSKIVAEHDIDLLVLATEEERLAYFERAVVCSERYQTRLLSLPEFEEQVFRRVPLEHINSAWFQSMMHPRFRQISRLITRPMDIAVAIFMGLLTLPLWAGSAAIMRVFFGRPVIVTRPRVGERGQTIELKRFRVARREVTGAPPGEDAPAVGFGKFLRRSGIERLPVLINLLRGDVTLVGPRPLHPRTLNTLGDEIAHFPRRQAAPPGLTGWAQLAPGDAPEVELARDLFYLKHQSVMLYLYILVASITRVPQLRADSH